MAKDGNKINDFSVERVLDRVGTYPFETDLLLADRGFYNEQVIRRARELAPTVSLSKQRASG